MGTITDRLAGRPITAAIIALVVIGAALLAVAFASAAAQTAIDLVHRDGYTRYARVERSDGTWREMFIANEALAELRATSALPDGATILMESYRPGGDLSSVFLSRTDGQRWTYGSISPGEPAQSARVASSCAGCHRLSQSGSAVFTWSMIERFIREGDTAVALCDRGGRSPCDADVYRRASRP